MNNFCLAIIGLLAICVVTRVSPLSLARPVVEDVDFPPSAIVGGLGPLEEGTVRVHNLVEALHNDIKEAVCKKLGFNPVGPDCKTDHNVTVLGYRKQIVAGINYFVRLECDTGKIWDVRIFEQPWHDIKQLKGIDGPKTKAEEIAYFEA